MPVYSVNGLSGTLVASTALTVVEIKTPATTGIRILKWWAEFNSVTSTDKFVFLQVGQFTAAVTTISSATPMQVDYGENGLASQCTVGTVATTEGAGSPFPIYERHQIAPNTGIVIWEPREMAMQVPASSFFRIRVIPGSAITSATGVCGVTWEE